MSNAPQFHARLADNLPSGWNILSTPVRFSARNQAAQWDGCEESPIIWPVLPLIGIQGFRQLFGLIGAEAGGKPPAE